MSDGLEMLDLDLSSLDELFSKLMGDLDSLQLEIPSSEFEHQPLSSNLNSLEDAP